MGQIRGESSEQQGYLGTPLLPPRCIHNHFGQTQRHLRRSQDELERNKILRTRSPLHLVPWPPLTSSRSEINCLKPGINNAASLNIPPPLLHRRATHPQQAQAAHLQ